MVLPNTLPAKSSKKPHKKPRKSAITHSSEVFLFLQVNTQFNFPPGSKSISIERFKFHMVPSVLSKIDHPMLKDQILPFNTR